MDIMPRSVFPHCHSLKPHTQSISGYIVVDPGAGVSRRSATRDGDGVEDDESEEMTQEDEPNSYKADHLGRPADNGVGRRCSHNRIQ